MKSLKSLFAVLTMILLMTSCFNDLNPKNLGSQSINSATVYNTTADYKSGLAKLYASFAVSGSQGTDDSDISGLNNGFGVYLRALYNVQELTTDEAVIAWNDQTIKNFHWHTWAANDNFILSMYSRALLTVSYANGFIRASAGSNDPEVKTFNAEARFIRALAYWHALDLFGNPPFVTEKDLPGAFFPKQTDAKTLYAYIDSELKAIENELGDPGFEYGRADKAALWMLQAKLYLNAETYLGTGQGKYAECMAALDKIFTSNVYSLNPNYLANFSADNNLSPEIIFAINYDGAHTQSYGGMDYIIHAQIGGSMTPGNYGVAGGWGGLRTTSALVGKFTNGADTRAQFYTAGQSLVINDIGTFTDGYAIKKFTNKKADGSPSSSGVPDFVDTDYPMFRLADAYLMYAEADMRANAGVYSNQSMNYINLLQERAFGSAAFDFDGSGQFDLQWILDERARELYWEGHRRTDLIRYGQFTGGTYLWPWKGNVKNGAATESFRNLFPIPQNDISANPSLKQNPGY